MLIYDDYKLKIQIYESLRICQYGFYFTTATFIHDESSILWSNLVIRFIRRWRVHWQALILVSLVPMEELVEQKYGNFGIVYTILAQTVCERQRARVV